MHRKALKAHQGIIGISWHYKGKRKEKKEGITSHKEAYKGILKAYKGI